MDRFGVSYVVGWGADGQRYADHGHGKEQWQPDEGEDDSGDNHRNPRMRPRQSQGPLP
jgi:hypothetical protein